jgi:hypothetical protein
MIKEIDDKNPAYKDLDNATLTGLFDDKAVFEVL